MTNRPHDTPAVTPAIASESNVLQAHLIHLTPREQQVSRYLIAGLSDKEISQMLNISVHTVQGHNKSLYLKFGINKRTQLAGALSSEASS